MTHQSDNVCERCEQKHSDDSGEVVEIGEEAYSICDGCVLGLQDDVELFLPSNRYTEEHHEKAVKALKDQEEILCVDENYAAREIWVHTNYVDAAVVKDVMDHFSYNVYWWRPVWKTESDLECVKYHGSCFEICLSYDTTSEVPLPVEADINYLDVETLEESDKQF